MIYPKAQEFKNLNGELYAELKNAISSLIKNKKIVIGLDKIKELNLLKSFKLIFEKYGDEGSFILKRKERLVGFILLELIEESMNREISNEIIQAFKEIDEYLLLIKQPRPRSIWYLHLDKEIIEGLLLKLYYEKNVDIISMLYMLQNDEEREKYRQRGNHLYTYEWYCLEVLNELNLETKDFYDLISVYIIDKKHSQYAKSAIKEYCSDPEKGTTLYIHGRNNQSEKIQLFNTTCLIEISKYKLDFAYNEAVSLKDTSKADCIIPIMFFKYDTADRLSKSFDLVINNEFDQNDKVRFYCKALNNDVITEKLVNTSFEELKKLFYLELPALHHNTLWWIEMIDGYDEQKNSVLELLLENKIPFDPNHYFGKYKNKEHFFNHLKNNYAHYKGGLNGLVSIIQQIYNEQHQLLEEKVMALLTSKSISDANLAIEIIKSKHMGIYDMPYLDLTEANQLIAFERITTTPFIFEDLFPSLSKFSNSEYASVTKEFQAKCFEYVDAYGSEFIKYADRFIDNIKFASFLAKLKEYNDTLESHFLIKKAIKEFDPYNNYYHPFQRYLEYEHRKMALMQDHFQKNNKGSIIGLFKNISVIRGSAFKAEQSDVINKMGKFSSSKLLDKRIYENPIEYEENYDKIFNSDNQ